MSGILFVLVSSNVKLFSSDYSIPFENSSFARFSQVKSFRKAMFILYEINFTYLFYIYIFRQLIFDTFHDIFH